MWIVFPKFSPSKFVLYVYVAQFYKSNATSNEEYVLATCMLKPYRLNNLCFGIKSVERTHSPPSDEPAFASSL